MNFTELPQKNSLDENLSTSQDTTSDYSKYFNPSLTLYNGLTQEEIIDLQKRIVIKDQHSQQNSFKVSKRSRLKNHFKQPFQRLQKKKNNEKISKIFTSLNNNSSVSNGGCLYDNDIDSLSCYNYFKTDQLSLLFDISMSENNKGKKPYKQVVNQENKYIEQSNREQIKNYKFNENGSILWVNKGDILEPPLSSSTENFIFNQETFKNFPLKKKTSSNSIIISKQSSPLENNYIQYQLFQSLNFLSRSSSFSRSILSSTNPLLSSNLYSIPTFKEKRQHLTVPKIVGNLLNGSINVNSQGQPSLSYQNANFYSNKSFLSTSSLPIYVSQYNVDDPSKIKFDEKSSLFVYENLTRLSNFYTNNSTNLKPILKNTINKRQDIELKNAEECDKVELDQFLKNLIDTEDQNPFDSTHSEMKRNKQLIRYYKEETQNLINDHYTVHDDFVSSIPLPKKYVTIIGEKKRKLLGVTELY